MDLGGRFELLELLGEGGMGAVWRARDRELDELVALKLIRPELAASADVVARFRREVKLARRVTHRHVARVFELGARDGIAFFTMELIEGRSLAARLRADGRLPWREAVAVAAALAQGLEAAHAVGVVHRDVKPDNILVEDGGRVVLTDFGIAAVRASGDGLVVGTPAYMAPEQAAGEPPTAAADVYATGVVLYELLTGALPWRGSPAEILASRAGRDALEPVGLELEPALVDVVRRATARDPARRLRSAAELGALLGRWSDAAPTPARPARRRTDAAVRDLVVEPPRVAPPAAATRHLADAAYEQLVARLWQSARLRLVTGWQPADRGDAAATVTIEQADAVTIAARDPAGRTLVELHLPATAASVHAGAAAAAAAIAASLGLDDEVTAPAGVPAVAVDAFLRGRGLLHRMSARAITEAIAHLDEALAQAPGDRRIAATRAMALARLVYYQSPDGPALRAAAAAADEALARSPDVAETHIAAGHVALHRGDAVTAAQHLRRAIALAPHAASAHEWLGRLLLEAGHLDEGLARVESALALDPRLEQTHVEIARAFALEGDWARFDVIARELIGAERMRGTPWAARFAAWRGDVAALRTMLAASERGRTGAFGEELFGRMALALDGQWAAQREALLALAAASGEASARRACMTAQVVAEVAGAFGDVAACGSAIGHALDHGFFDLHWLDRCPLLAAARAAGVVAALRPRVAARAQRILDALYGEGALPTGTADTVVATPSGDGATPPHSRNSTT